MIELAKKRLAEVKKKFPDAQLIDPDSVRVVYLISHKTKHYHQSIAMKKNVNVRSDSFHA